MSLNLSGTLNIFRLLFNPALALPHATVATFNDLPSPLTNAFKDVEKVDIRAVVLDKDNCFAVPKRNEVFTQYKAKVINLYVSEADPCQERFQQLREAYPGKRLLIVSNSAGTLADPGGEEADLLENATGVRVLRHRTKKPGCGNEIQKYFLDNADTEVTSPSQIAVVGDRIFTDVMLANMMGARAIWIRDGVVQDRSLFVRVEKSLSSFLLRRGFAPPNPKSSFE